MLVYNSPSKKKKTKALKLITKHPDVILKINSYWNAAAIPVYLNLYLCAEVRISAIYFKIYLQQHNYYYNVKKMGA